MLIAVDIGNSFINIGYFTDMSLIVQKIETHPLKDVNEYKMILRDFLFQNHIENNCFSVIISSVVYSRTPVLKEVFSALSDKKSDRDVLLVSHKMNTGLRFRVNSPEELGTDRIVNSVGAWDIYKAPVAVVDFGTATTITVVGNDAHFIGGSIMPGLRLMNDMLFRGTSKLKKIVLEPPSAALGADTSGCICSGLFYGTAGAVERVLDEIEKETHCTFNVIITGGHCAIMDKFIRRAHDTEPHLTLKGLKILHEKNKSA
jgi:type III pantothenate kinase